MKKTDRTKPTPREVYYAARRASFMLPEEQQTELDALLKRGYKGAQVHRDVLGYFDDKKPAYEWLQQALYTASTVKGYATLPGSVGPIPARSLWVCPKCDFTWRVLRKGRPVPPCPHDGLKLVPAGEVAI